MKLTCRNFGGSLREGKARTKLWGEARRKACRREVEREEKGKETHRREPEHQKKMREADGFDQILALSPSSHPHHSTIRRTSISRNHIFFSWLLQCPILKASCLLCRLIVNKHGTARHKIIAPAAPASINNAPQPPQRHPPPRPSLVSLAHHGVLALDGADHPPRRTSGADNVLVCDGEKVALLHRKLFGLLRHGLHVVDHLIETERGKEDTRARTRRWGRRRRRG